MPLGFHDEGIFLLILGGVKGIVDAIEGPFPSQFETNFGKKYNGVVTIFVILSVQVKILTPLSLGKLLDSQGVCTITESD